MGLASGGALVHWCGLAFRKLSRLTFAELIHPSSAFLLFMFAVPFLGWAGLLRVSLLRRIRFEALLGIVATGVLGGVITCVVVQAGGNPISALTAFTGIWLFNAFAARWVWRKLAGILRESNRED